MDTTKHIEERQNSTTTARQRENCNCKKKEECPLNGDCLVSEVVYQATVNTQDMKETYIGLTATSLRQDTVTTRCHSGMKKEEMRLSSASTCGS